MAQITHLKKHYPWLLFDADGTLFDYNQAEGIALKNAFESVNITFEDGYLDIYRRINRQLWLALEKHEITPTALQLRRFELLQETLRLTFSPGQMGEAFVEHLAIRAELIDGAYEILETLQQKCRMAILTNGLQTVQRGRLAHSSIRDFITELIISEEVGAAKPKPDIFAAAFARLGHPSKTEVLMIGDSLTSDMQGGVNYGIDTCWFNPTAEPRPSDLQITYEITHLRELLEVLV
jgi:YjjG family noncanonical pyrimidine nucleotidase